MPKRLAVVQGKPLHPRPAEEAPGSGVTARVLHVLPDRVGVCAEPSSRSRALPVAHRQLRGSSSSSQLAASTALAPQRIEPFVSNHPDLIH